MEKNQFDLTNEMKLELDVRKLNHKKQQANLILGNP